MIEAKGHNGQMSFDGHFVSITRKGGLARMTVGKGEKRIPLASITAVQLKPAGAMVNGYLQLTIPGGNESKATFGKQTFNAVQDENSIVFTKKQQGEFEALRAALEAAIVQRATPGAPAAPTSDLAEQLTKLAALRDQGILSDEEFAAQKAKLLG